MNRDLTRLIINYVLIDMVIVLESFLVCKLRVYLNPLGFEMRCWLLRFLLFHTIFLFLCCSLLPEVEQLGHISHAMVSVEQSGHRVEQILIVLQVLLRSNVFKFESLPDINILQGRVAP